jgi:isopentenyl diphosphate isomerase/L-lactate dehydrogenase-like FMN-dependent dehydrogenase
MLDPCGMARVTNAGGECAVARAAARAGTVFVLSGAASHAPERVAEASDGPLWFQLYLTGEVASAEELLGRVWRAGYQVLCVTVDAPVVAARERDYRNRLELPPRLSPRLIAGAAARPRWTSEFLFDRVRDRGLAEMRMEIWRFAETVQQLRPVTLDDLRRLRELWPGRFVVKGVMRGEECPELVELGADGIVVSNHGGRQLDYLPASIDVLPEVVDAVNGRAEVLLDSGVRRGTDVVKALALGARACMVGRPYLWGLASGGQPGVERAFTILNTEIDRALALLGRPTLADLDPTAVRHPQRVATPAAIPAV